MLSTKYLITLGKWANYRKYSMVTKLSFHAYTCTRILSWARLKDVSSTTDSTDTAETTHVCFHQLLKTRQLLAHGLQYFWLWWSQYFFVERAQKNLKRTEKLLGFFQAWKKPDDCMLWLLYSWYWRMRNLNWLDRTMAIKHIGMYSLCSTMHLNLNIEDQYNILKNGY